MKKISRPVKNIIEPINEFFDSRTSGGILLLVAVAAALFWANSIWADAYKNLFETKLAFSSGELKIEHSLRDWINDGLMVLFFLSAGLEIKYEFLQGELSDKRKAMMPLFAAIGGMIFPAAIYISFNFNSEAFNGWGIPMATDIAFVLGILALLRSHIPSKLRSFLLAYAVADDIGAVLVIAVYYSSGIDLFFLGIAGGILVFLIMLNLTGVNNLVAHSFGGVVLWIVFLNTGVHPTISGVLLALTIPLKPRLSAEEFIARQEELVDKYRDRNKAENNFNVDFTLTNDMENNSRRKNSPLKRMERKINQVVYYLIIPLFILANAGIEFRDNITEVFLKNVSIGIMAGLFIGKPTGIFLFSWISYKLKITKLPAGVSLKDIYFLGILGGVGFTVSLFISNIALTNAELLEAAKIGLFTASLISGILAYLLLRLNSRD